MPGLVVALLGAGYFWRETRRAVQDAAHREALALAEFIDSTFTLPQADRTHPHSAVAEVLGSDTRLLRSVAELRVLTPEGRIRWSRQRSEEGTVHPEAARLTAPTPETARSAREGTEVIRPLGGSDCIGCHTGDNAQRLGVLQVRLSEPQLSRQLSAVFQGAMGATLVFGLLLALATGLALHFFFGRPLRKLTEIMRRAEEGDFLVRAETRGTDEISRLGSAFNQMLARLTSMKAEEIDTHRDLALANEKLALKEKLEERITELSLLFDVAHSLNSTLELNELLERITRLVVERLKIPNFSIMLRNPEGLLEIRSAWPQHRGSEGLTFGIGEGACGRAAETLRAVYLPDVGDRSSIFAKRNLVGGTDHGSLLAVPMVHMDQLLGVMNFQRPEVAGFSPEELELLMAVADQAATAVKNARLHSEAVLLTMTDPLTGLPNRRHLFGRLEAELARAERYGTPLSILMIDVDHFKRLNDSAGHRAGDETLRKVCDVLKPCVRKVDTVARYGGEEFMVLLPQTAKEGAVAVGEKLRRAVLDTAALAVPTQPTGHITISIGVASYPLDASDQETLVDCVDAALYASKRGGRNKVSAYEPGMEIHPGRERGPHAGRTTDNSRPLPPAGVAKA